MLLVFAAKECSGREGFSRRSGDQLIEGVPRALLLVSIYDHTL